MRLWPKMSLMSSTFDVLLNFWMIFIDLRLTLVLHLSLGLKILRMLFYGGGVGAGVVILDVDDFDLT